MYCLGNMEKKNLPCSATDAIISFPNIFSPQWVEPADSEAVAM